MESKLVIDWEVGDKLVGGNHKLAQKMVHLLIDCLPEHQSEIKKYYQDNDLPHLASATHKLHGATCYCGTPRLKNASKELEHAASTKEKKRITTLYNILCREMDAVIEAVNTLKN